MIIGVFGNQIFRELLGSRQEICGQILCFGPTEGGLNQSQNLNFDHRLFFAPLIEKQDFMSETNLSQI